jgi:hypothetical protein
VSWPRFNDSIVSAQACGVSVSRDVTWPTGHTCRHIQQNRQFSVAGTVGFKWGVALTQQPFRSRLSQDS